MAKMRARVIGAGAAVLLAGGGFYAGAEWDAGRSDEETASLKAQIEAAELRAHMLAAEAVRGQTD